MRQGSTVLALVLAAWSASGQSAWALAGCDAFSAALRSSASDLGVEFSRAIVVSRNRSDANAFDVTTKVDVDATLRCRGDTFLRFEARISRAGERSDYDKFRALPDGGAKVRARLGRR